MDGLVTTTHNEWRMMHAIILSAGSLVCAAWFARAVRRREPVGGGAVVAMDAVLLWLLLQYAAVSIPALLGVLNCWTITLAAVALSALLCWGAAAIGRGSLLPSRAPPDLRGSAGVSPSPDRISIMAMWACISFLTGYVATLIQWQWLNAASSDDALTYHLPAAVRWLQEGRFVLHETWYFNPANTYSPLAGSVFLTWWYAPLGNDFAARFAQVQGLALIFLAMIVLCRNLGASTAVAAVLAAAAVLSRPIISQITLAKDDLFLAAFFLTAAAGLSKQLIGAPTGPWRLGVSLGLLLATKVTALLGAPMLLLAADAPWRAAWRWRQWAVTIGVIFLLAGPWYARNIFLTGNPLYPVELRLGGLTLLDGMFRTARSQELSGLSALWRIIATSHFGLQPPLAVALPVAWLIAAAFSARRLLREPLVRLCTLGPLVGIAVFILAAPFAEVRFLYPAFLLLFAAPALIAFPRVAPAVVAGILLSLSLATGFHWSMPDPENPDRMMLAQGRLVGAASLVMLAGVLIGLQHHRLAAIRPSRWLAAGALALLPLLAALYVMQDSLVNTYAQVVTEVFGQPQPFAYGEDTGAAWEFVRNKLPRDQTLAYANTYLVYPLMGFHGDRRVVYAPVRPGVQRLSDLPSLGEAPIPGEQLRAAVTRAMEEGADREVWLANLRQRGAGYLFVMKGWDAPELTMAQAAGFEKIFENAAAVVYRVK